MFSFLVIKKTSLLDRDEVFAVPLWLPTESAGHLYP